MKSLTAPERETVINFSDDETTAHVWTAQRPVITRLKEIRAAELVNEGFIGSTAWAEFRLPAPSGVVSPGNEEKLGRDQGETGRRPA